MPDYNNSKPPEQRQLKMGNPDYILLLSVVLLTLIGVIMVFSSSYYDAGSSGKLNNDMYYFFRKEVVFAVLGFVILAVGSRFPYQNYQNWSRVMYLGMIALLIAVLIAGKATNGATRWIMGIQPSEPSKVVLILVLSNLLAKYPRIVDSFKTFCLCIVFMCVPIVLVGSQNVSTAIVMAVVGGGILFVATRKFWYFIPWGAAGVLGMIGVLTLGEDFRSDRIKAWLDPQSDMLGTGYQILQGLYAVGSGGLFGVGLGQSRQKLGFIPESHNDIIFAVICEELGAFGAGIIVLLYMIMIWRCIKISLNATSMFGTLIAAGVAVMVGIQVFINISVVTNTIPNTGIPLPFISYGGTSMLTFMIAMSIVLNISRYYRE